MDWVNSTHLHIKIRSFAHMLNKILYAVVYSFSLLPLSLLLAFAKVLAYLNFYIIGYRKKLVIRNITNSFPNKTEAEILAITKMFYVRFFSFIMESLKLFSTDINELQCRTSCINPEIFSDPILANKSIVGVSGHLFNWEWLVGVRDNAPQKHMHGIYHPLTNKFWDEKIQQSRAIVGTDLITTSEIKERIRDKPNDGQSFYVFISDQSPSQYKKAKEFITFLNQPTAVITGWANLVIEKDFNLMYVEPIFVKPGHYQYKLHHIRPDGPEGFEPMELVKKYHELLEKSIHNQPFNYLWTHKKWKHKYPNNHS